VRAFAAERGVTDYLVPLYELTRKCFPGVEITVTQEWDYEIAGLGWIIFQVAVYGIWNSKERRAGKDNWIEQVVSKIPPDARGSFVVRME
jgi:hypothetical protein